MATEEQPNDRIPAALAGALDGQGWETAGAAQENSTASLDRASGADRSRRCEPIAPGTHVGRYEVIELVGSGGAGHVYRARDPQLERFVALKLLHASRREGPVPSETRGRLLREARTLARLSHPNVVAAYDVGVHEGALFVAMEFIDRWSMRDWLAEPRGRDEIVRVLIAAGRGLAAAHAADVCHRDFKPANVMIASDGRVRVVDFGLARTAHGDVYPQDEAITPDSASAGSASFAERAGKDAVELALSSGSAQAGTPGFMAPEQLRGQAADARSDQFSYAVTAFLALTGAMPHLTVAGHSSRATLAQQRLPWPRKVPRRIRRVIDRGLEPDPARRYPSLGAMVTALERATAPRRHWPWQIGIGAAALSGSLAAALVVAPQNERGSCEVDASAFAGIWDAERQSAVERAFQATGRRSQADAFARISSRLDAFRDEWLGLRQESCELMQGSEFSERAAKLRSTCLDGALAGAKALVDGLSRIAPADVDRVAGASPPALRACSEASPLSSAPEPPTPELAREIAEVERQIAGVSALIKGGLGPSSVEQARHALELARATGHAPVIAKATVFMGRAAYAAAGTAEERGAAEAWLRDGMRLAADSGQDLLLAKTASYLFCVLSYAQVRIQESEAMLPMVQAIVARAGNPPEQRIEMLMGMAYIELEHERYHEAIALLEEVRRLAPSAEGEIANYGFLAARDLSHAHMELRDYTAAVPAAQEALDGIRRTYGPGHPRMLFGLSDLAIAQSMAGLRSAALASIAEARRVAATLPADEPRLKNVARAEGVVWQNLGDCERALPPLSNARQLFTAAHGASHPLTTGVLESLGACLAATGRSAEAIETLEQVLSNKRAHGAPPVSVAGSAFALAKELWSDPKQRTRALTLIDEADSTWRKAGATQPMDDAKRWLAARGK